MNEILKNLRKEFKELLNNVVVCITLGIFALFNIITFLSTNIIVLIFSFIMLLHVFNILYKYFIIKTIDIKGKPRR